ncbi:MAG: hypothetical protein WC718_06155 [Phycisphaerales bacterium]|jgi:hypothetical protein
MKPLLRWILILMCGLALGPWALHLLEGIRDVDGGHATTLLANASPVLGFAKGALVLFIAAVVGILGAYAFSLGTGYMCAGLILAWSAWGVSTLPELVREGHVPLVSLAAEGLLVTLCAAALAGAMSVISNARQPADASPPRKRAGGWWALLAADQDGVGIPKAAVAALGAGVLAGGFVVWLVAASQDHGQVFAAVLCGAIAAGVAGQLTASNSGATLSPVTTILAMLVLAAVSPILAQVLHGAQLTSAVYGGTVLPLARPLSFQWAAGAMIGAPIGIGWAGAMLDARAAEFGSAS